MVERHSNAAYWILRIALGVLPIAAGLDKFTNLLADWDMYLSPLAARVLPVSPEVFLRVAGVMEVVVGAGILLGFARWFGWVAAGWLTAIALNLVTTGNFLDLAARDLVLAASAVALAELAGARERARGEARQPAAPGAPVNVR
jgi:uncharacterized membrane protein YphA (DoxX/SURF4 family)